jgi:hypothetical protein
MDMLREVQEKKNALQKFLAGRDSRQADWRAICIKNPENMMFSGQIHNQYQYIGIT